jgi:transcription elongation factor GreA
MKTNTQLTQEGYNQLFEELKNLKEKKEKIISEIEEVAQPDESGEDGLATQLKEELELLLDKTEKIEATLETAKIISGDKKKSTFVQVGSTVKIKISGNSTKEFYIVSDLESDPAQNKISNNSPLGQALLGKKVNEAIEVSAPVGKITYKIIAIK